MSIKELKKRILPKSWDESNPHAKLYSEIERILDEELKQEHEDCGGTWVYKGCCDGFGNIDIFQCDKCKEISID